MDAPLRLETESYEDFTRRLHELSLDAGVNTHESEASVAAELRRLQIDPDVFYRNAPRLGLTRFNLDDFDPLASPPPCGVEGGTVPAPAKDLPRELSAPAGFAPPSRCGLDMGEARGQPSVCCSREPAAAAPVTAHSSDAVPAAAVESSLEKSALAEQAVPAKVSRRSPANGATAGGLNEDEGILTDADHLLASGAIPGYPNIHVPTVDEVEDLPLDAAGETVGGRSGRATPGDMSSRLQVDSLTDDEDEDWLPADPAGDGSEPCSAQTEDAVEAFAIDPDFDYDNVVLTRKFQA